MREAAITALVTLIGTSSAVKVTRESSLDLLSARDFPAVVLTDNGAEEIEYKTGGLADVYVDVDLDLLVQKSKSQSTALNALDLSVKKVIASDSTLGSTVAHVTIMPQEDGETLGNDNYASRKRKIRIFYEASTASGL